MSDSVENRPFNDKNKWDTSLLPCCSSPCVLKHHARITNTTTVHTLSIAKTPSKLNKHLSLLSFVSSTDHDRCCNLFRLLSDLCTRKHYVIAHVQYNQTQNSNMTPRVCKQNCISFYNLIVSLFPVETWAQRKPNIKNMTQKPRIRIEFWYFERRLRHNINSPYSLFTNIILLFKCVIMKQSLKPCVSRTYAS